MRERFVQPSKDKDKDKEGSKMGVQGSEKLQTWPS